MFWAMLLLARQARGWRAGSAALRRLAPRMAHSFAPLPEDTTKDVLDYWFTDEAKQRWFASTAAFDRRVADRYSATLETISDADEADVAAWATTAPLMMSWPTSCSGTRCRDIWPASPTSNRRPWARSPWRRRGRRYVELTI